MMGRAILVGVSVLLTLFFVFHADAESEASTAPMEKREQEALYSAIQGFVGESWNGSGLYPDPCGWTPIQGVSCDLFGGFWYVTTLSVGPILDNSLRCSPDAKFSAYLFEMKHMRSLTFYNCFSSDTHSATIPSQGWEMLSGNLESLEFRSNRGLIGETPASLGLLVHLQTLVLEENALTGQLPQELGQLVHLKRIALSGNRFTGPIPASLGSNLAQLLILDLSRNSLTGPLPTSLGGLTSLLKLDLSNNILIGDLPREIGSMKSLNLLDLRHNNLSGGLAESLQGLISIQHLLLSNNPMGGNLVEIRWENLMNLTTLDLCNMSLTGNIPESLAGLMKLRFLDLKNNSLSGRVTPKLAALPFLSSLYLNGNNLTGKLDFSEDFYQRMGTRFASWNNPNLCYSAVVATGHALVGLEQCKQEARVSPIIPGSKSMVIGNPYENSNVMTNSGVSTSASIAKLQEVVLVSLLVLGAIGRW